MSREAEMRESMLQMLKDGYDVQAILNQATTAWMGEQRVDEERQAYDEKMRTRDRRRLGLSSR